MRNLITSLVLLTLTPSLAAAKRENNQCRLPDEEVYDLELYICQGNPRGRMCCSYGPDKDGCLIIACRNSCASEWEAQNRVCRQ